MNPFPTADNHHDINVFLTRGQLSEVDPDVQVRQTISNDIDTLRFMLQQDNIIQAKIPEAQILLSRLLNWFSLLERNNIIIPPIRAYARLQKSCRLEYLYKPEYVPQCAHPLYWEHRSLQQEQSRANWICSRIQYESAERCTGLDPWGVVFNTLTFDSAEIHEHHGTEYWSEYIENVENAVSLIVYGCKWKTARNRRLPRVHTYIGIVERGKQGRIHYHVMHFMKKVPHAHTAANDPNRNIKVPYRRLLTPWYSFWTGPGRGYSYPVAFRYSGSDYYALRGFRWPVQGSLGPKSRQPLKATSVDKAGAYMAKYLAKGRAHWAPKGGSHWRTRVTKGFGMAPLKRIAAKLPAAILTLAGKLAIRHDQIKLLGRTLPPHLLLKHVLRRKFKPKTSEHRWMIWKNADCQGSLPDRLLTLTLQRHDLNSLSTGFSSLLTTLAEAVCNEEKALRAKTTPTALAGAH